MSTFSDRIKWLHGPAPMTTGGNDDAITGVSHMKDYKDYGSVKQTPLTRVQIYPNGILAYDEPLISADGAPITSTGPATWGQVYAAGRY